MVRSEIKLPYLGTGLFGFCRQSEGYLFLVVNNLGLALMKPEFIIACTFISHTFTFSTVVMLCGLDYDVMSFRLRYHVILLSIVICGVEYTIGRDHGCSIYKNFQTR